MLNGNNITAVAEAKWTNKQMSADVLTDLIDYKLPALAQAGFKAAGADIVLASRSGFTEGLLELGATTPNAHLIEAHDLLSDLVSGLTPTDPQAVSVP